MKSKSMQVSSVLLGMFTIGQTANASWVTWTLESGGNGHSYLAVSGSQGLTWEVANQMAQAQGGYLATITSSAENAFVYSLVNNPLYFTSYNGSGPALGGYQIAGASGPADGWRWVTGEAWTYDNWMPGTPDDGSGFFEENRLHFFSNSFGSSTPSPLWNDIHANDLNIGGYIIEVPEPGSVSLLMIGALMVGRRLSSAHLRK